VAPSAPAHGLGRGVPAPSPRSAKLSLRRFPGRVEHEAGRSVAPARGLRSADRGDAEMPGSVVEQPPQHGALSNRGRHSQSTDPSPVTNAAAPQSDSSACWSIGVSLMRFGLDSVTGIFGPRRGPRGRDLRTIP
jgi:hypothetical protein